MILIAFYYPNRVIQLETGTPIHYYRDVYHSKLINTIHSPLGSRIRARGGRVSSFSPFIKFLFNENSNVIQRQKIATSFLPGRGLKCAEAAGDRVQGKGCPLSLGKEIFQFFTSLDVFSDHFLSNIRRKYT